MKHVVFKFHAFVTVCQSQKFLEGIALGVKSMSPLDWSPWNFAQWWEIDGALELSPKMSVPPQKCGEAKIQ